MKKAFLLILLLGSLNLYSQNIGTVQVADNQKSSTAILFNNYSLFLSCNQQFTINFNLKKPNYMAVYNKSTMKYDFYPADLKNNFNLYSSQVANQYFTPNKIDSFNPFGTHNFRSAIGLGIVNQLLQQIQH